MSLKHRLGFADEPLYLVDGSSFLYRGFYAFPNLRRSDGFPTNALYIVIRILQRLLREERPSHAGFFLDAKGRNFRHEMFTPYKAHRDQTPEPLELQFEPLRRGAALFGLTPIILQGAEADDGIASLARRFSERMPVVIVGSDKDLRQCLAPNVVLWDPGGKGDKVQTLDDFTAEYGITPASWPDLQALVGDSSDNIPGVPGIGPKSALSLIRDWPDLEALKAHLSEVKPAWRDKIAPMIDEVFTYRELTRLRTDLLPEMGLGDLEVHPGPKKEILAFLSEFEFRSLARELAGAPDLAEAPPAPTPETKVATVQTKAGSKRPAARQLSLFTTPAQPESGQGERRPSPGVGLDQVPDLAGASVGLVAAEGEIELAYDGRAVRPEAETEAVADRLAKAGRVYAPSLKDLLHRHPAWGKVPLAAWFDISLAGYLLNPEDRNYTFERLLSGYGQFLAAPHYHAGPEAALDLGKALEDRIRHAELGRLMTDLEMPLVPVLVDMEKAGIGLDLHQFEVFLREVSADIERLTKEIHELAGGEFNIRSSRQLAEVLFGKHGLKLKGKTPGGAVSTSVEALERHAGENPIVDKVLEYRKLEKLRSTYLDPLPRLCGPDGRIHTTFNQLATATGRLSSSNPNLQNIPTRGPMGRRMRACFTAAPGFLLASADYSQIELRVLAHFSEDKTLIEAFEHGLDIHAQTAALLCDKRPEDISREDRRMAKTINFGVLYGMGPQKLSRELGITMNTAKDFIAKYFERLGKLKAFYEEVLERAARMGYVTSMAGRRRFLPELHSQNNQLQAQAKRQAVNTVIQGSAADIIKMAMLAVAGDQELRRLGARLILQVHDELVVEAPEKTASQAGQRLADIMSTIYPLRVPLAVATGVGHNWAEAH